MEAVWRPFHDETAERTRANEALRRTVSSRFVEGRELRFSQPVHYEDYAAFLDEVRSIPWIAWDEKSADAQVERATRAAFEGSRTDRG